MSEVLTFSTFDGTAKPEISDQIGASELGIQSPRSGEPLRNRKSVIDALVGMVYNRGISGSAFLRSVF